MFRRALLAQLAVPICLFSCLAAVLPAHGAPPKKKPDPQYVAQTLPFAELEPFVVKGEDLSITVFARNDSDRRYAERFAEPVVEVAYETIEKSTGDGLVIVGEKDEPHPFTVYQTFLKLADEGKLSPEFEPAVAELRKMLADWEARIQFGDDDGEEMEFIDPETVVSALPIPLEGIGAKLYLLSWKEEFDPARIDAKLATLKPDDFDAYEFSKYEWIFFLPPKSALQAVLKKIIPAAMKKADIGLFKRAAIRAAIAALKPAINDFLESVRKAMLYYTVLRARSGFEEEVTNTFMEAYIQAVMPHGKLIGGGKQDRALEAVAEQKRKNAEYEKNPFVSPTPLENPDLAAFQPFVGAYGPKKTKETHHFTIDDGVCHWQYRDWKPGVFHPAGENLLVSDDGKMTIEFIVDSETGAITNVRERWARRENMVPGKL